MIRFRKAHPVVRRNEYFFGEQDDRGWPAIAWHGIKLNAPDWSHDSHTVAFTLSGLGIDNDLHVIINMWTAELSFELPGLNKELNWHRSVDTFLPSPEDIAAENSEFLLPDQKRYPAGPRSVVILVSK
jgi:glycogen operon protein